MFDQIQHEYGIGYVEIRSTWTIAALLSFQRRIYERYARQNNTSTSKPKMSWQQQFAESKSRGRVQTVSVKR